MSRRATVYAVLATAFGIAWGDAVHWFLTPHPEASTGRGVAVGTQLVVGFAGFVWALWAWGRVRRRS